MNGVCGLENGGNISFTLSRNHGFLRQRLGGHFKLQTAHLVFCMNKLPRKFKGHNLLEFWQMLC